MQCVESGFACGREGVLLEIAVLLAVVASEESLVGEGSEGGGDAGLVAEGEAPVVGQFFQLEPVARVR